MSKRLCSVAAAASLAALASARSVADIGGVWNGSASEWPQDLPSLMQPESKPGSPLLGNGWLGLAVAAYPTDRSASSMPGLGSTNSIYGFLGSNNMWSCNDAVLYNGTSGCYGTTNDTRPDGACCQRVGLSGVALQFAATWGNATNSTPSFRQVLANGTIEARWPTPSGLGAVSTLSAMLHDANLLSTRVEYAAGAGDAPALAFDVLTWVGAIAGPQKPNSGQPRNSAIGCADLAGAPAPCGAGPQLVYATRRAATDFIGPNGFPHTAHAMPVNATIATGVLLGPGASVQLQLPGAVLWRVWIKSCNLRGVIFHSDPGLGAPRRAKGASPGPARERNMPKRCALLRVSHRALGTDLARPHAALHGVERALCRVALH